MILNRIRDYFDQNPAKGLYLSKVFTQIPFALYSSVITMFWIQKGLAFSQIGLLWSVTLISTTLFDFPTGNFADKYGRIKIYILGLITMGLGRLTFALGSVFSIFLFGAILIGFGESQMSGALTSWFMDKLEDKSRKKTSHYFGNNQLIGSVLSVITGLGLGTFLWENVVIALIIAGVIEIIGGLILLACFRDNYGDSSKKWIKISAESLKFYSGSKVLVKLTILLFASFSFYSVFLFIWQPIAVKLGILEARLGYLYSLYVIIMGVSGFGSGQIVSKKDSLKNIILITLSLFITAGLVIMATSNTPVPYLVGFILFGIGYGAFFPIFWSWSQAFIPSHIRSSITSLISTISSAGLVLMQVVLGYFIDGMGYSVCAYASLILMIFTLSIITLLINQKNAGKAHEPGC